MSYLWTTGNAPHVSYIKLIDVGGYTEVHQLFDTAKQEAFARKIVRPFASFSKEDVENESRAILKIYKDGTSHRNIVHVLNHGWLTSPFEYYFIDMELCDFNLHDYIYGDRTKLLKCLRPFPKRDILDTVLVRQDDFVCVKVMNVYTIMTHIVNGLEYIHSCGQVHRDLKPKNILYCQKDNVWKITDFGTSAEGTSKNARITLFSRGTAGYRAPEVLREEAIYTNKVDIWAIGCILYEVAAGTKVFHEDWAVREYAFGSDEPPLSKISSWPSFANLVLLSILEQLLQKEWDRRPDARTISIMYQHLFDSDDGVLPDISNWERLIKSRPEARYLHSRYTARWETRTDYGNVIYGWKRLVDDHPTDGLLLMELREAIARNGDYLLGASVWEQLLEKHPEAAVFTMDLLYTYGNIREEERTVALTRLKGLAETWPQNLSFQRGLAWWYKQAGMHPNLINVCKKLLTESSTFPEGYFWACELAMGYEAIQDHTAALGVWKVAFVLHQEGMLQGRQPAEWPWTISRVLERLSDAFNRAYPIRSGNEREAAWNEMMSTFPRLLTPEEEQASGVNWCLTADSSKGLLGDMEEILRVLEKFTPTSLRLNVAVPLSARVKQLAQELAVKTKELAAKQKELADERKASREAKQRIKELEEQLSRQSDRNRKSGLGLFGRK